MTHTIARERTHAFVARRDVGSFEDKGGGRYFGTFDVSLRVAACVSPRAMDELLPLRGIGLGKREYI